MPAGSSHTSGHAPEPVGLGDGVTREEIEAVSASLRLVIFVTLCTLHYLLGDGLVICTLHERSSGLGSNPGRGHYVVILDKTLFSHSASLHPGV